MLGVQYQWAWEKPKIYRTKVGKTDLSEMRFYVSSVSVDSELEISFGSFSAVCLLLDIFLIGDVEDAFNPT